MPLTIPTPQDKDFTEDLLVNATTEVLEAISAAGITNDDISQIEKESTKSKRNLMKEYFRGKLLGSIVKHDSGWKLDKNRPYYSAILAFLLSKQNVAIEYNKDEIADGMNQFAIKLIKSKKLVPAFISGNLSYENGDTTPGIDKLLLGSVFKMGTQDEIEKSFTSQKTLLDTLISSVDPKSKEEIQKSFNSRMNHLRDTTKREELKEKIVIGQGYRNVDQLKQQLQLQFPENQTILINFIASNDIYKNIKTKVGLENGDYAKESFVTYFLEDFKEQFKTDKNIQDYCIDYYTKNIPKSERANRIFKKYLNDNFLKTPIK